MRVLITGINGFVGSHLMDYLVTTTPEAELHGTVYNASTAALPRRAQYHALDLRDADAARALLNTVQPDQIYHLAAQSFVPRSFEAPWDTLENNIKPLANMIAACLQLRMQPRLLVISSAQIYSTPPDGQPITEDTPLRPSNPYSVSKVAADLLALQYFLSHKLPIIRARPFNHFGPGQSEQFVAADFAMQIARIEAGRQEPVLLVGNLSAQRDYADVRDVVRAYRLLMEQGIPGEAYNIASGKVYSIQTLLDTLLSFSPENIEVRVDPVRFRPVDVPLIRGEYTRLHNATGWQPEIPFEQTVRDVLDDCRHRAAEAS